jgi:CubicO group peptidase (beta-lactamase class C family)
MSADAGRLSLDDSPKKFLPYFRLRDPEADARVTLRDLLSHRSGLNRTDLAMATGKLNREELIRVAAEAAPAAKLGERFLYQNVMYTAAGEAVARADGSTYEKLLAERILKPLGMGETVLSVRDMRRSRDFSFGYEYDEATKETRRLKFVDIDQAAPAGAVNSSARDMAQWLRLLLGDGVFNGRRLVSEARFGELFARQISVAPGVDYGLGWFLRDWQGHKVAEHGGNIDGFNAEVALMPDHKLGFALLTNVTSSPLGGEIREIVWSNLVGGGQTTAAQAPAALDAVGAAVPPAGGAPALPPTETACVATLEAPSLSCTVRVTG